MADAFKLITDSQASTNALFSGLASRVAQIGQAQNNLFRNTFALTSLAVSQSNEKARLREAIRVNNSRIASNQLRDGLAVHRSILDQGKFERDSARASQIQAVTQYEFEKTIYNDTHVDQSNAILKSIGETGEFDPTTPEMTQRRKDLKSIGDRALGIAGAEATTLGQSYLDQMDLGEIPNNILLGDRPPEDPNVKTFRGQPILPDADDRLAGDAFVEQEIAKQAEESAVTLNGLPVSPDPSVMAFPEGKPKQTASQAQFVLDTIKGMPGNPADKAFAHRGYGEKNEALKESRFDAMGALGNEEGAVSSVNLEQTFAETGADPKEARTFASLSDAINSKNTKIDGLNKQLTEITNSIIPARAAVDLGEEGPLKTLNEKSLANLVKIESDIDKRIKTLTDERDDADNRRSEIREKHRPQSRPKKAPVAPEPGDELEDVPKTPSQSRIDELDAENRDSELTARIERIGQSGGAGTLAKSFPLTDDEVTLSLNTLVSVANKENPFGGENVSITFESGDFTNVDVDADINSNVNLTLTQEKSDEVRKEVIDKTTSSIKADIAKGGESKFRAEQFLLGLNGFVEGLARQVSPSVLGILGSSSEFKTLSRIAGEVNPIPLQSRAPIKKVSTERRIQLYAEAQAAYAIAMFQSGKFIKGAAPSRARKLELAQ